MKLEKTIREIESGRQPRAAVEAWPTSKVEVADAVEPD
jgi:hypothetical protein